MDDVHRLSLVVFDGTVDKLTAMAIMASGGVMNDMEVDIFVTFWGLMAFRKGEPYKVQKVTADFAEMGPEMGRLMQEKHVPHWFDTLKQAREMGNVKIYACGMTADLFDLKKEDFEDVVDDIVGVGEFVDIASEGKTTLFI